jgi:hypothetical protein
MELELDLVSSMCGVGGGFQATALLRLRLSWMGKLLAASTGQSAVLMFRPFSQEPSNSLDSPEASPLQEDHIRFVSD